MIAIAKQNRVRISPQKARLVCQLIANKPIAQAQTILANTDKKGARILLKLLNGVISNATNNHAMKADALYVYEVVANQGPVLKRTLPRAKGSADVIRKRSTNFVIQLSDDKNERSLAVKQVKELVKKRAEGQKKLKEKMIEKTTKTEQAAEPKQEQGAQK
ncbi:50S ribosomal protein L22 [[Mycoplasma] testudinis]|uniref:50S ribosomal protein L22 n=1 Tax=[Mycoplasma] testudinis TaxID=33924 RepID=UPI000489EED0|nr:50S ribosomal protein L22 [[Mycoplasma] testudinis]